MRGMLDTMALIALALLCLVAPQGAGAPVYRARCTLAGGGLERVQGLRVGRTRALEDHERFHGWRRDGHDVIVGEGIASCSEPALEWLAAQAVERPAELTDLVAVALERNGRAEDALAVLRERIEFLTEARESEHGPPERIELAELGARLAWHSGQHESGHGFLESWPALHWCGTCDAGNVHRRDVVRADLLFAAGRLDDLAALAQQPANLQGMHDPSIVRRWVQLEQRRGGEATPDAALSRVRQALGDERPRSFVFVQVEHDLATLAAPADVPVERLSSVAHYLPEVAMRRLLTLDAEQRSRSLAAVGARTKAPHTIEWDWHPLVALYAELGFPELEGPLKRRQTEEPADERLRDLADLWQRSHEAWLAWTEPR